MGAIMVTGTLTVCSGIASTTLWFNNYDCRCRLPSSVTFSQRGDATDDILLPSSDTVALKPCPVPLGLVPYG
jgi:hypothetical protein